MIRILAAVLTALAFAGCAASEPASTLSAPAPAAQAAQPTPATPSPSSTPEQQVADPVSVTAPDAGIDTTLIPVGLDAGGAMELPDPGTGAWYDLGPRPGEPGPAVLIGHVDSVDGPDVFFGLNSLSQGDVVTVATADGTSLDFVVEDVEVVAKDALPYDRIWAASTEPLLRLITCGGEYDRDAGGYQHNVVAYARAVEF